MAELEEIENADRLVKALGRVQQAASDAKGGLPIGTQVLSRTKSKGGFAAAEIKALFGAAVQGGLIDEKTLAATRAQMVAALGSIGRDSIAGLLNGLKSGDADTQNAAKSLGNNLITSFKTVLGIASPSREFKKIGESAGQGFEQGLLKSIEIAEQSATRKMQRMLDRLARMALMMSGMSGPEIGKQVAQARALPSLNFGATTPRTPVSIGPSSTGRALPPGASRPELPGTAFGRQKYLPTALGEGLKEVLRGAANAFLDSIRQNIRAVTVTDMGAPPSRQGLLQGGSVAGFLPGRASAASVLELNNILAGAIREYFKSVAREIEYRSGSIGKTPLSTTPLLAQSRVAGLLPQSVGRTPSAYRSGPRESQEQLFARRTREAYINSAARAADQRQSPLALPPARERSLGQPPLMTAPSIGESRARPTGMTGAAPQRGPSGGGPEGIAFVDASRNALAYDKALTGLRESIKGVQVAQLPLVGGIKGLAGEFGQATKQVLLYGTAYKGLAFLTSLPGEAFNAAKALGTYKNQLQAVTSETGTFSNSLAFVDNLAQRFNVPLESARQGFVKLYASMQPAGFSQGQIEGLFTGISQASAAFGLSADKVDRVNYAFAQMASKGQIMSEELKGQLGDVLPGALSLFAEAAKMSIPEFSKAMEDGAFKADAMIQVLENVGILMKVKFGAAAEGAAKTLQGALNGIQNNLKLMYEALGPVVDRMAAVFGPQVTSLIKNVTDVIKAFELGISTTGDSFAAMSPQAQGFYSSIQSILPSIKTLVPSFIAAGQNIGYFASSLATAFQPLLGLLKLTLDFISIPFVARVAVYATIIGTLTSAFTLLKNTGIIQATIAMIRFIATLTVAQVQAWISSIQSAITALVTMTRTANIAKLSLMALKVTLISFGVGAVLLGLDFVVQRLLNIGLAADDAKKRTAALTDELARAVETGNVALTSGKHVEKETEAQSLGKSKQILERFQGGFQQGASMTKQEYQQLQRAGLATGINFNERKGRATATSGQVAENLKTAQAGYVEALNAAGSAQEALADSVQVQGNMQRELEASRSQMKDIPPATGADGAAKTKKERESRIPQLTLELEKTKELSAIEMQIVNAQLMNNTGQLNSLELLKQLVEFKYEAKRLALEDLTTEERAQKYKEIGLRRELAIFKNQLQLQIDLKKERDEIQQGFAATLAGYQEEANFQQMYLDLINQGILPSLAKVRVEAEKAFAQEEKKLDQSIEQIEVDVASLELKIKALKLEKNLTTEKKEQLEADEKRLETLKDELRKRGLLKDTAPERRSAAIAAGERTLAPKTASEYIGEGEEAARDKLEELMNTGYQVVQAANAIGDAFGEAFKGVITGSMTAQEALAGMFRSIADHFADMVAQMIAEYLKMQAIGLLKTIFNAVAPALGGWRALSSGFSAGTSSAIDTWSRRMG
jgi:tape measure domain-containing protein